MYKLNLKNLLQRMDVSRSIKPINMKSNVCNSLNCSAQYIGHHD